MVFAIEAVLFLVAAIIALRLNDKMGSSTRAAGRPAATEAVA
jgi:hypothetical protein